MGAVIMKKTLLIVLVLGILIAGFIIVKRWPPSADTASLRQPPAGAVVGFATQHHSYAWLGIPYAQPPVNELRWRAPQPLPAWQTTRKALAYGSICPQLKVFSSSHTMHGSEDCLTLNVWAPNPAPSTALPVMVWIHGGGNSMGYSAMGQGERLAGVQHVVVVSLNYRLGVLGWLSHPALREHGSPEDASGNYGLLDQIAALQWVQHNIAAFGGDPHNITIFGESAGAHDVMMLVGSPLAKGLFQRAISQSGSLHTTPVTTAENYRDDAESGTDGSSREFINKLLIADGKAADRAAAKALQQHMSNDDLLAYLHSKSPQQLLAVVSPRGFGMYDVADNFRDGYVLPNEPLLQRFTDTSQYNAVPLILGTNRDEMKFFMADDPELVDKRLGFIPHIENLDEYNRITRYYSDAWKALAVDEPAAVLQRAQGDSVFVYRFDWRNEPNLGLVDLGEWLGAAHGMEITFIFGKGPANLPFIDDALSAQMMRYWTAFARDGRPGNGDDSTLPQWTAWQPAGARQIIFDDAAHGGVRMSDDGMTLAQLRQRLHDDPQFKQPKDRCKVFAKLFLLNPQMLGFDNQPEYEAMNCAQWPPERFAN